MRRIILTLIACSSLAGCGPGKTGAARDNSVTPGRWLMVAVPPGVDVPGRFERTPAAVWRMDTETGALEFCYLADKISCGPVNRPASDGK